MAPGDADAQILTQESPSRLQLLQMTRRKGQIQTRDDPQSPEAAETSWKVAEQSWDVLVDTKDTNSKSTWARKFRDVYTA